MLLRNYYNALGMWILYTTGLSGGFDDSHLTIKAMDGTETLKESRTYCEINLYFGSLVNSLTSSTSHSIFFGTGTTPVTYDDYTMANMITSGLTMTTGTQGTLSYDSTNNVFIQPWSVTLTNTSSNSITITEIGCGGYTYISGTNTRQVLYYREVLTTPFTIPSNQAVRYTHNFTFKLPSSS